MASVHKLAVFQVSAPGLAYIILGGFVVSVSQMKNISSRERRLRTSSRLYILLCATDTDQVFFNTQFSMFSLLMKEKVTSCIRCDLTLSLSDKFVIFSVLHQRGCPWYSIWNNNGSSLCQYF
jgi:hypothetical protein